MSEAVKSQLKRWQMVAAANAFVKARLQEKDALGVRDRYDRVARERGLTALDGPALERAIRQRIGARAARLGWPRAPGDLHVFVAFGLCNWEAVLPGVFTAFGKVSTFEWRAAGFDDRKPDWLARRDEMNRCMLQAFHAAQRERPVDVVVAYVSGHTASPETLQEMANAGAVVTNFCFDDKVVWPGPLVGGRYPSTAAVAAAVDLNLTSDPNGLVKYAAHGGIAMFHAEAADPELHGPVDVPFEYDVSFIGSRFGWRPRLVESLRNAGIDVACFGNGWERGPVSNEEMKLVYGRSRINLGVGGIGYSRRLVCLKGRDFEVPMSGALYLTQHNPELDLVFDVGREIVTYRDEEHCARVIRELLADEARAASIRAAGRARCLRDHTYHTRWSHVFRVLGALA